MTTPDTSTRTQLGTAERDRIWKSTLNGAEYRWGGATWEVRFKAAPEWHSVRSGRNVATMFSYAGEKFVEVNDDGE